MKKRRLAAWLMVLCLCAAALGGCGAKEEDKKADTAKEEQAKKDDKAKSQTPIKVGALKGPTAMGMAQMLDDNQYEFTISASPDEIVPMIVQGQVDIAAVPANLAAVLYQKTQKQVNVLAVNTLGILYLVENGNSIQSVEDLKERRSMQAEKGRRRVRS